MNSKSSSSGSSKSCNSRNSRSRLSQSKSSNNSKLQREFTENALVAQSYSDNEEVGALLHLLKDSNFRRMNLIKMKASTIQNKMKHSIDQEESKEELKESNSSFESQDSYISKSHQHDDNLNIDQPTISLENDINNKVLSKSDLNQNYQENNEIAEPQINDLSKESQYDLSEAQDNNDK